MKRERKVMINHSSISCKSDMEESVMFCPELSLDPPPPGKPNSGTHTPEGVTSLMAKTLVRTFRSLAYLSHAFTGRAGGGVVSSGGGI